jgi:hypothetical protein
MRIQEEEFITFLQGAIIEGQSQLANHIRRRLLHTAPDLLECLDFTDDGVFLEPLLFSYFSSQYPSAPLAQILFGYIPEAARPPTIDVVANDEGVIDLPRIGYLVTTRPGDTFRLCWDGSGHPLRLLAGNTPILYELHGTVTLADTPIEVCWTGNPVLKPLFSTPAGEPAAVVVGTSPNQLERLNRAVAILRAYLPHYFGNLCVVTRRLVVFAGEPYSFATIRAHGIAFLRANEACSTVFYLEDVVHQCGHMIFNALSLERSALLAVDPQTPVRVITGTDDEGSIYGAFHGLFTQMHINQCFRACLHAGVFTGHEKHELCGRLADDMKRFASALTLLNRRELYTDLGWWLFNKSRNAFEEVLADYRNLIVTLDTSNQPYIFDYAKFLERNPWSGETAVLDG